MSILYIRRVNSIKKKEREQVLKASNIGVEFRSSGDKNITIFKKSEIARLIQIRTNHFLSTSYQSRIGNQIKDICTFCKKEEITRDHLITRYTTLKNKNLNLIKKCRLDRFNITRYKLTQERRRRREVLLF